MTDRFDGFRSLPCPVPGVQIVLASSARSLERHSHEEFGIGLVRTGGQRSHSGRGQVEAGPGDVITVNPGEVHDGSPVGDEGRSWSMLYLGPDLVARTAREIAAGRSGAFELTQPVVRDRRVAVRFLRLFEALTRPGDPLHREERLFSVIASLGSDRARPAPRADPPIAGARALVDEDPAAPLLLADLARACGLSRFQVIRGFVRETGLTPHAYMVQRRLELVRRRIAAGGGLAEAALDGGFADQSHMTRVFAARYGLTPGAWAAGVR